MLGWVGYALRMLLWCFCAIQFHRIWASLGGEISEWLRWTSKASVLMGSTLGVWLGVLRGPLDEADRPYSRIDLYLPLGVFGIQLLWISARDAIQVDALTVAAGGACCLWMGQDVVRVCAPRMDRLRSRIWRRPTQFPEQKGVP